LVKVHGSWKPVIINYIQSINYTIVLTKYDSTQLHLHRPQSAVTVHNREMDNEHTIRPICVIVTPADVRSSHAFRGSSKCWKLGNRATSGLDPAVNYIAIAHILECRPVNIIYTQHTIITPLVWWHICAAASWNENSRSEIVLSTFLGFDYSKHWRRAQT